MQNQPEIDRILNVIYNIKADIIIGKNLRRHFIDISQALVNVYLSIRAGQMNSEDTESRQRLREELIKLKAEIVEQLKTPD